MNSERIKECTNLANEILRNIELSEMPMKNIPLKCLRLCRLLNDEDGVLLFTFESSGYPLTEGGYVTNDAWRISEIACRRYWEKDDKTKENTEYINTFLFAEMEETLASLKLRLQSASDPNISLSSANPLQYVGPPLGNANERGYAVRDITTYAQRIEKVRGAIYKYVLNIYNKLKYGVVIEDIFTNSCIAVNEKLSKICPEAISKFVSVYNNIDSGNSEDWANAVHSCRRIIKDVADRLYPPTDEKLIVGTKTIELTEDKYINRLIQFIVSKSSSSTYSSVVGTSLESIGNRIDAINEAVCKGTHTEINRGEAQRYIIYTYLLLGDIVSLME
jgi:hypothetical protein